MKTGAVSRVARIVAALLLVTPLLSCAFPPISRGYGTVSISFTATVTAKTVQPAIEAASYTIAFAGDSAVDDVTTSAGSVSVSLPAGVWAINVSAYDASGKQVARGDKADVAVASAETVTVAISLYPTMAGTGSIDVSISWPDGLDPTVSSCDGTLEETAIAAGLLGFDQGARTLRYRADVTSGSYALVIRLLRDGVAGYSYQEAVQVYDNLTSQDVKNLSLKDFAVGGATQIVADHSIVDRYLGIPDEYVALVKRMWLDMPGESHSSGVRIGLALLAAQDSRYAVAIQDSGTPEAATSDHLRVSRASWGDVTTSSGWLYNYGEEDWYTSATAISRTRAHLAYCDANGFAIAAFGFGWCWDMTWHNAPGGTVDPDYGVRWAGSSVGGPEGDVRWGLDSADASLTGNSVCMDTYLAATQGYADYCAAQGYPTKVFFTTGPVDGYTGENAAQREIKHDYIRSYVLADEARILFDYADIVAWDDTGAENTQTWNSLEYQMIADDNMLDLNGSYYEDGDHIGERGALRLAKAMWWMLARIAGWEG